MTADYVIGLIHWFCGPDWLGLWIGVFSLPFLAAMWRLQPNEDD